jgi:acetyltransferase-like isoleucine patch superfamily enzyme
VTIEEGPPSTPTQIGDEAWIYQPRHILPGLSIGQNISQQ